MEFIKIKYWERNIKFSIDAERILESFSGIS